MTNDQKDISYFFLPEITNLPYKKQAEILLDHLYLYEQPRVTDNQRTFLTTIYLRAYCGCEQERFFNELTQEWIEIDTHTRGCLIPRFPIEEDLSPKTIKRRRLIEKTIDMRRWTQVEEGLYA